jgi:hypothetical protein
LRSPTQRLTTQISPHSASPGDEGPKKSPREDFNLPSDFKVIWVVQSLAQKAIRWFRRANQFFSSRRLIPMEGRVAIVRNAGWDAVNATASARRFVRRAVSVASNRRAERAALFPSSPGFRRMKVQTRRSFLAKVCRVRQNRMILTPQGLAVVNRCDNVRYRIIGASSRLVMG